MDKTQKLGILSTQENVVQDCTFVIRALDALKQYPKLLARIDDIMNHTVTSADGERVFANVDDAGELYTIIFLAVTSGTEMEYLNTLVQNMEGDDRATSASGVVRVTGENDEGFDIEPVKVEGTVLIATDWT